MDYSETQIKNAIHDKPETKVFYQITPVYKGEELMPRDSRVKAYSINDDVKQLIHFLSYLLSLHNLSLNTYNHHNNY